MGESSANMLSRPIVLLLLLPFIALAADVRLKVQSAPTALSTLGVIFEGNINATGEFERVVAKMEPGETTIHNTFFEHSFVLRSSDFDFRVRVTIQKGLDVNEDKFPYRLTVKNLNHDATGANVEMVHPGPGGADHYIWIGPGKQITHGTGKIHAWTPQLRQECARQAELH